MKSRNKLALINSASAALYALMHVIVGIVLPRLFIINYGSEINGLTTSVQQVVNYLNYFEVGITPIFLFSLYGPLVAGNFIDASKILTKAKKTYYKITLFYFIGVLIITPIYPLLIKGGALDYWSSVALIFITGTIGALNILSLAKYRVLLTSDQKVYVLNLVSIIALIVDGLLQILLIHLGFGIVIVKAVPLLSITIRTIVLEIYVRRKYPNVSYNSKEDINLKIKFKDTLLHEIAKTIGLSAPLIALSIVTDLKTTSVFGIYSLVFNGLQNIVSTFTMGTTASFGHLIKENQNERFFSAAKDFNLLVSNVLFVLYFAALVLIIPFINLYLGPIEDLGLYTVPIYPLLFTIWMFIENSKLPAQTILQASGNYKLLNKLNLFQIILHVVLSFVFSYFWGMKGALISVALVSFIKLIGVYYYAEKELVPGIFRSQTILFIVGLAILVALYFVNKEFSLFRFTNIGGFILNGVISVSIATIIIFIFDTIVFRKNLKSLFGRLLSIVKRNKK